MGLLIVIFPIVEELVVPLSVTDQGVCAGNPLSKNVTGYRLVFARRIRVAFPSL